MRTAAIAVLAILLGACVPPAHLRYLSLSRGGRDLPELFLGGWDGRRLKLHDDTDLRVGASSHRDVVAALSKLSNAYGTVYVDSTRLEADESERRGFFCDSPWCLVVFDRAEKKIYADWGEPLAIFELSGVEPDAVLGNVWLVEKAVRAPGPSRWPLKCRDDDDMPRNIHPDGNALFPARSAFGEEAWARFGPSEIADAYRSGASAPSEQTCSYEEARRANEPSPEKPEIEIDPSLLKQASPESGAASGANPAAGAGRGAP